MKKIILMLAAVLALSSCSIRAHAPGIDENEANNTSAAETTEEITSASLIDTMSIEEKVGQLFLVRCDNENIQSIIDKKPAGLVMFGVDFENLTSGEVKAKISGYQEMSDIPLIIAVDEEGGTVTRVSSNPNLAPEKYKSPLEIYNEGGLDALRANAAEKSKLLLGLGINMNLAPVADIPTSETDFIYDRSLGTDPIIAMDGVAAIVTEMENAGIGSCLKHFPGYGNNVDTHTGIAVDERPIEQFFDQQRDENGNEYGGDFFPFQAGIEAGADAVLVSHNIVKCMDADLPASLSPAAHNVLRDDLEFGGIIMTDDMAMEAVAEYGEPYIKAVLAGNNLMIVSDFDTAYSEVLSAVKDGRIDEETLDNAIKKVIDWKTERRLLK